ncbi:MAG: nitroreductase family protein [Dehalococcoidia bacterium]
MDFDLEMTDALLSTTRAVRKRMDFDRPVPREVINECLELAIQAPTASNSQTWRWMVVDDPVKKKAIADLYRKTSNVYLSSSAERARSKGDDQTVRVYDSAEFLAQNLERAPVFVIPCVQGRPPEGAPLLNIVSAMGSIFPAVWSFQLALRSRGLGSVLTTLHLVHERETAELLGIPENILQVGLVPVAYTKGTDFQPAKRPPVAEITHWNEW